MNEYLVCYMMKRRNLRPTYHNCSIFADSKTEARKLFVTLYVGTVSQIELLNPAA